MTDTSPQPAVPDAPAAADPQAPDSLPEPTRQRWHDALDKIKSEIQEHFGAHRDKIAQFSSHADTLHMVIDDLHDTRPPQPQ